MTDLVFHNQAEAARILRVSERTMERMRVEGTGPRFRRFGRRVVYEIGDLEDWANARAFNSTSEGKKYDVKSS